jgi:hypothetical protein
MPGICKVCARSMPEIYRAYKLIMPYVICLAYARYTTWLYQAHLTNNKDVFLCILCYLCRSGMVQQYQQMLEDLVDDQDVEARSLAMDQAKIERCYGDRNFSMLFTLGVRYPTLQAMVNREDLHLHVGVSLLFIFLAYAMYTYDKHNHGILQA